MEVGNNETSHVEAASITKIGTYTTSNNEIVRKSFKRWKEYENKWYISVQLSIYINTQKSITRYVQGRCSFLIKNLISK